MDDGGDRPAGCSALSRWVPRARAGPRSSARDTARQSWCVLFNSSWKFAGDFAATCGVTRTERRLNRRVGIEPAVSIEHWPKQPDSIILNETMFVLPPVMRGRCQLDFRGAAGFAADPAQFALRRQE